MNKKMVDGKEITVEWADKGQSQGLAAQKIKRPTMERVRRCLNPDKLFPRRLE